MRWAKPNFRSSFLSLFASADANRSQISRQTDDIRSAMLEALGEEGARLHPAVSRRIRFAGDVQSLWYARSDLMSALASLQGEGRARQTMDHLTAQFEGLLPKGLFTGHAPLHH